MATRLTLLLLFQSCTCDHLPVILIDYTGTVCRQASGNPFKIMPSSTFAYVINDAMYRSDNILIFLEDHFDVEDVSSRDRRGTPFLNLHEMFLEHNAKYISRVADPFPMLQNILPGNSSSLVIVKDNKELQINTDIKYHFIHFMEPKNFMSETRIQRLRRHDNTIKQTYMNVMSKRSGLVIVFYTGKSKPKPVSAKKKEKPRKPKPTDHTNMLVTDQALIKLAGVKLQQGSKRTHLSTRRAATRRLASRTAHAATGVLYEDDLELDFNFEYMKDSWLLESIVLLEGGEEVGRKTMGVGAPYGYSYFCSEPLFIVNSRDKSYVTISKYQVEPQLTRRLRTLMLKEEDSSGEKTAGSKIIGRSNDPATTATEAELSAMISALILQTISSLSPNASKEEMEELFKELVNDINIQLQDEIPESAIKEIKLLFTNVLTCGTNFNCHILAGLFVAFIVIGISSIGILMLFDCQSNNRLDDPAQKPLVIMTQL